MRTAGIILLAMIVGGAIVYFVMQSGRPLPNLLASQIADVFVTPTLTPVRLAPATVPPTATHEPSSRLTATPIATIPATPKAMPTAVSTTAPAASEPVVSEQEMVVNAFAECGGQYSGRDKAFRSRAAASAIADGRQTVANISALVEEHCGGVSGDAATTSVQRAAISTPTPHPTRSISAAATVVPTQTPLPLALGPVGGDGRFRQAELEAMILQLINVYRKDQGLPELKYDERLAAIARSHSQDMATNDFYGHTNLKEDGPSDRARKADYNCHNPLSIGIAENIYLLYGHVSSLRVGNRVTYQWLTQDELANRFVAGWIASPGHRRNILDRRYSLTGIGVAFGTAVGIEHGVYVTQNFC